MPCKLGALHFGKRLESSSNLEKASDLASSNTDILVYRKGLFISWYIFFSSGMNIEK